MGRKIVKTILGLFIFIFITAGTTLFFIYKEEVCNTIAYITNEVKVFAGIKVPKEENIIVKYNGTTIEEAVKSNSVIEEKAEYITEGCLSEREKAHAIYSWIGTNIQYDNDKADRVLSENEEINDSGAIYAFRDRSGVCFDYASLYVAMARSANLKVRLVIGEAFDGHNYVNHSWNEVYLKDEKKWINVDSTFFVGGDYFDSENFNKYRNKEVVGEW